MTALLNTDFIVAAVCWTVTWLVSCRHYIIHYVTLHYTTLRYATLHYNAFYIECPGDQWGPTAKILFMQFQYNSACKSYKNPTTHQAFSMRSSLGCLQYATAGTHTQLRHFTPVRHFFQDVSKAWFNRRLSVAETTLRLSATCSSGCWRHLGAACGPQMKQP